MKVFHFCTREFYEELLEKKEIIADDRDYDLDIPAGYIKNYAFNIMKINNGCGMFFTWTHPDYKGPVKYDPHGDYALLELDVNEDLAIKTNYENWCSCALDIFDCNGDLKEADLYCREEFGIKNGLKGSYEAIFDISNSSDEIQVLLPLLKSEWIISCRYCKNKNI